MVMNVNLPGPVPKPHAFFDRPVMPSSDDYEDAGLPDDTDKWVPEVEPFEDEFLIAQQAQDLPKIGEILPSQFTEFAFRMPRSDGMGYENFTFEGRRHMRDIYDTGARRILLFCGRQVEKSTLLGNLALCYSCLVPSFKTLYVSPSATQTKTFSSDRIKEPIETSPVLRSYTTTMLSQNIFEKQLVNRAKIVLRYAFLNADRCRGIPAWRLYVDELQDIIHDNIPIIEQNLSHAPENWRSFVYAGTPKTLDNTIEYYWSGITKHGHSMSTQNQWVVPCECKGGEGGRFWNILGEKNIGKKGLSCERCGQLINPMHVDAQWARTVEDAIFEGYRIPQLMVPWRSWDEILLDYGRYERPRFYNEVLGLSSDSGMRPLTMQNLRDCCSEKVSMHPRHLEVYQQKSVAEEVFAGIDWGCYSEDTRTLTDSGFKHHWEIDEKRDRIAQFDPTTGCISYVFARKKIVFDHEGDMIHFKTNGQDMLVTPDHKIMFRTGSREVSPWREGEAQDVEGKDNVRFPRGGTWQGATKKTFVAAGQRIDAEVWLKLLGMLISEGCFYKSKAGYKGIGLYQRDGGAVEYIEEILADLPFPHRHRYNAKTGDHIWDITGEDRVALWEWLTEHVGTKAYTKRIPRELLALKPELLRHLFEALMLGDGTWDKRDTSRGAYYTTSEGLADDVLELAYKLGYRAKKVVHMEAHGKRRKQWRVLVSKNREAVFHTRTGGIERVPYKGKAYCFSVPSGYFVTERNGCIAQAGNTGENTYTLLSLGMYVEGKFRIFYLHRFVGEDLDPDIQIEKIVEILSTFNVLKIGTDYGGGYIQNRRLVQRFGPQPGGRVATYQYMARTKKKLEFDAKLGRFKVHRTEVMSDVFNAIKRQKIEFPRWDEFKEPFGTDMLNIFSEYNETLRMVQYDSSVGKPDDAFHSVLYCFLASMLVKPRPDILIPKREVDTVGPIFSNYDGPTYQG